LSLSKRSVQEGRTGLKCCILIDLIELTIVLKR